MQGKAKYQLRFVGPVVIQDCTEKELHRLRERAGGHIKYLALFREGRDVMVLAQARDKMTPAKWREQLGCSAQHLKRLDDFRGAVDGVRNKAGFEEHGEICKKQHASVGDKRTRESEACLPAAIQAQVYRETEQRAFELAGEAYRRRQTELEQQYSRRGAYDPEEREDVLRLLRTPSAMPKQAVTWADVAGTRQRGAEMAEAAYSSRIALLEREMAETPESL